MIAFVNAKINLGLNIVGRRKDGYHDLQTVFYPVGLHNGSPINPSPFCDILEITPTKKKTEFLFSGNKIDCPLEKNLVFKAYGAFKTGCKAKGIEIAPHSIRLEKHIPDGAGLGGGSADASFALKVLNEMHGNLFSEGQLVEMAAGLGADCPFFIKNRPVYAEGIGERMTPVALDLSGKWCVIAKPDIHISTKEAFANISPREPETDIRDILKLPMECWSDAGLKNDFEQSLFPSYPLLPALKEALTEAGARYAAMSGSGSSIFGLFNCRDDAERAMKKIVLLFPELPHLSLSLL